MRRSRRRAATKSRRYTPPEEEGPWATLFAAGSSDVVDALKQATHDRLIAQLGPRRTSGIRWLIFEGTDAHKFFDLESAAAITNPRGDLHTAAVAEARALIEQGATLVVATCTFQP